MADKVKILLLGPAGYIGGTVLDALLKHPDASKFDITTYVRSEEKAKKVQDAGVPAITGSLTDLENAVADNAVVFNCASLHNLEVVEALLAGAKRRFAATKVPPVLIHTGGAGVVADAAMGQFASDKVYDDAKDEEAIDILHATRPQRNINDAITAAHKEGYVKAYVLSPPLVYGLATGILVDAGVQNPVPSGFLILSRIAKARGAFGSVGAQANRWSTVHVRDLADFYVKFFNAVVLEGKELPGGNTYYFPTDGDVVTKEFLSKIAESMHEFGAIKTAELTPYTYEEIAKWPPVAFMACNARVTGSRALSIGWKPKYTPADFIEGIKETIEVYTSQKEDFGANWGLP